MPVNLTFPGVYIDELPSAVRTIVGVPTSITAFVGAARRGEADEPIHITSWSDFERSFGGLWDQSDMSYAVFHYYQNGGVEAEIVRVVANDATAATLDLGSGVKLEAVSTGKWGNSLRARVDHNTKPKDNPGDPDMYNLLFNLLCIPSKKDLNFLDDAAQFCLDHRAIFLVDSPTGWTDVGKAVTGAANTGVSGDNAKNAALYFPRLELLDEHGNLETYPPSGAIAGVIARTDGQRGVWKAPAGTDASLAGVQDLSVKLTNLENGELNPLGISCIRNFPVIGTVVWGARTLRGADQLADQWKYLPVRRTALFIEESLYRGTQWVVFEPNDEPLWASIRLNVGAFMNNLFRLGAFQGRTPQEAYLIKCDSENNPQNDIDRGIVNILVGFAPLKPAEFVLIHIQQLAGQIQT